MNPGKRMDLAAYLDGLAAGGRHHFTTAEAIDRLAVSPGAARAAIRRARERRRIAVPHRGFHVLIPPEYRVVGCPPASHFVPALMAHLGTPYYVGLLSAARLHGAAHQAPMVFQVVVPVNRPSIACGRVHVEFIARRNVGEIPTVPMNTPRGTMRVATPEATAFDLVGYPEHAGGLSNVATVLVELAERMGAACLRDVAAHSPLPWAQRLGFLLEATGGGALAGALATEVRRRAKEYVALRPGHPTDGAARDARWRIVVNATVEPDL